MSNNEYQVRPQCPFCGGEWTDAMIAQYEAMIDPSGCACCGGPAPALHEHEQGHGHGHGHAHIAPPPPLPAEDLRCAHCQRAIYLAPSSLSS